MTEIKPPKPHPHPVPLYAATIHHAYAGGKLSEMKKVAHEAEAHLASHGDVSAALELLKAAIAKLEAR